MDFLRKISNWKTFCVLLIIYVFFAGFVMSGMMGNGDITIQPLDLLFSYTPQQAYDLVAGYGEMRAQYAYMSLTADTAYPVIYTALFMVLIMQLTKPVWPEKPNLQRLALIPLFAFVFDLIENHSIRKMLNAYPERLDNVAETASTFTSLKWSSVYVIFAIIIVLLVLLVVKKLKQ